MVIYGHSGSGKTTILNHIIKEKSLTTITSRCTKNSTVESIILDAFDELNPYYVESVNGTRKESISGSISTEYFGIKSSISGNVENSVGEVRKRIIPPQLTIQMNSEEIMVSNDFNGEAWHILDQLLAQKKTLYMNPVNQTVDIDECKKFIEFAKILW